jgi:hypothetical protein
LPEILALGIAQYSARIFELRGMGFRIENRRERVDGVLHTYFRLNGGSASVVPRPAPANSDSVFVVRSKPNREPSGSLFGDISPDRTYQE